VINTWQVDPATSKAPAMVQGSKVPPATKPTKRP
jgi:hypothetical protein